MLSFLFLVSNCPNSLTFFSVSPTPIENEKKGLKRKKKELESLSFGTAGRVTH